MNIPTAPVQAEAKEISSAQFLLLCIWIWSLTIGLDIFSELKLFDIIAFVGIMVFQRELSPPNWRTDSLSKWSVRYLICGFFGVLVTLIRNGDFFWMQVTCLRFYRFSGYICLFLIIRHLELDKGKLSRLLNIVFLSVLVQAVLIVLQKFGQVPILWPKNEMNYGIVYSGTLGMNHVNSTIFMTVGISAAIGKLSGYRLRNLLRLGLTSLSVIAMILAMVVGQARGSFVALAVLLICFALNRKVIQIVAAVSLAMVVVQSLMGINVYNIGKEIFEDRLVRKLRFEEYYRSPTDWDIETIDVRRPNFWRTAIQELIERPDYLIFGVGFQNFKSLRVKATSAHNTFVHVLAELGIAGLIVLCIWLRALWRSVSRLEYSDKELYFALKFPGVACFFAILAVACFNEPLYPHRNTPGFLSFFLSYLAIIAHPGWLGEGSRSIQE